MKALRQPRQFVDMALRQLELLEAEIPKAELMPGASVDAQTV